MKKQVTLTALGLLTVVGGSWLVAQQSDPVRETRTTRETRELTTLGGLVTDDDVSETPRAQDPTNPAQVPMKARRPSAASSPRASARPRQEQDARAIEDLYRQEARNYAEGATAFEGLPTGSRAVIVSNPTVAALYGAQLGAVLRSRHASVQTIELPHTVVAIDGASWPYFGGYGMGMFTDFDAELGHICGHSGGVPGYGSNMRWITGSEPGAALHSPTLAGSRIGVIALGNTT